MGFCALRNVLKQACQCATQWYSVLREWRDPIKERNKQKRKAMCSKYSLIIFTPIMLYMTI
ncbi:hypothetical protein AT239_02760 [Bartonella henselae]|nr:hypothetical protein AT239_02760 [Bartonella henselae]OLL55797.1 hypothetical protein AT240_00450 [Bartonella henselae]